MSTSLFLFFLACNSSLLHSTGTVQKLRNRLRDGTFARRHLLVSVAYTAQMTLAYFIMLVVMTYNSGLFISIMLGFGFGYDDDARVVVVLLVFCVFTERC